MTDNPQQPPPDLAAGDGGAAGPAAGVPLDTAAVPTDSAPVNGVPTEAVPTEAAPTDSAPTDAVPTGAGAPAAAPQTPGAILAAARARTGLSVADVAAMTRIRQTLIHSIEADDYSACGADVYARGHLRSYAHAVGVDAEPLLASFDSRFAAPPQPPLTVTPIGGVSEPVRDIARRAAKVTPRWPAAMMGVLGALIIVLLIGWLSSGGTNNRTPGAAATAPPVVTAAPTTPPAPTPTTPPTTPPTTAAPTTTPPITGVSLQLAVTTQTSWISVRSVTGAALYQGILSAGQSKSFTDPVGLVVKYGNAPAVTVQLNGRTLGPPTCGSQVCTQQYGGNAAQAG